MSSSEKQDHGSLQQAVDKVTDAAGAVVGKVSAALGGGGAAPFVKNATLSDMYEVRAAAIAKERARTRQVRAIADKLGANHTMTQHLLFAALGRSVATHEERELPDRFDARRQSMLDHLERAPDEDFDKTYLDQQAAAHDEAHTLFKNFAENGADPHLRSHALSVLPGLEAHMRAVAAVRLAAEKARSPA